MADLIEPARTGRSRCRGCGESIAKGELRFGEEVANPYADEGDARTMRWYHVRCGADRCPVRLGAVLALFAERGSLPDLALIEQLIEWGTVNPKLAQVRRAEQAPSGRSRCRECRQLIDKDALRLVLDVEDDTAMAPSYFVHAACAVKHMGAAAGLFDKLRALSQLEPADLRALEVLLAAEQR